MKVIGWKGKGLKKCIQNVTRCINCQQKCTQYAYSLFINLQSNEKQVSLCPLSTNLIIKKVISVHANTVTWAKLREWYGVGFTSTRVA